MQRISKTYRLRPEHKAEFYRKALLWADRFNHVHFLQDNGISDYPFGGFQTVLAAGADEKDIFRSHPDGNTFERLQAFYEEKKDWIFGYFSYDLKNETEDLHSQNPDLPEFPLCYFYVPQTLIFFGDGQFTIQSPREPNEIYNEIYTLRYDLITDPNQTILLSPVQARTSKEDYIRNVEKIKNHILEGDVYELNYCIEFFSDKASLHPPEVWQALNELSPMPFSAYLKVRPNRYLMCASPERFLKKQGNLLISQPIKGTAKRGKTPAEDQQLKHDLQHSEKERAENMMIVDLVRNDLNRSASIGSVQVQEMFGIYTFKALHQMISTVTAQVREGLPFTEVIKNAFPMGSMTGAPKIRAMQLIDDYEAVSRGLYSGAVGYVEPNGDFDFNVVIRSIVFNAWKKYLSFSVGSAITYDADPEKEYQECLLKAEAMQKVLLEMTDYRPFYKNKKKKNLLPFEAFKLLFGVVCYTFFLNRWMTRGWWVLNEKTAWLAGGVVAGMLLLYAAFKTIPYQKSRPWNILHNWVAHLLNGAFALCFALVTWGMMALAAFYGFFFSFYLKFFEKKFDIDEFNREFEKTNPVAPPIEEIK